MKLKKYFNSNRNVCRLFLLVIFLLLSNVNCSEKPSGHTLSNIEDDTTFIVYIKEMPTGTVVNSIDLQGNYHCKTIVTIAGQQVDMTLDITPDRYGDWKTIDIDNPYTGAIHAKRLGNRAKYFLSGKKRVDKLPEEDYAFFKDFA